MTVKDRTLALAAIAEGLIKKYAPSFFSEEEIVSLRELVSEFADKLLETGYGSDTGEWVVIRRKYQAKDASHAQATEEMAVDRVFFSRATALAYCAQQNANGAAGQYRDMLPAELWQEVQQLKTFKKLS